MMLKQRGVIKRSDADASVEQKLILDFKSSMHCIISFAYLSIFMNLWCVFIFEQWLVFIVMLLNLRFVIILNYVGLLIYVH
jgi:hypothetical protein